MRGHSRHGCGGRIGADLGLYLDGIRCLLRVTDRTGIRSERDDQRSFSRTDRNGDGVISANELSSFIVHSFWNNDTEFTRCARDSKVYSACGLNAFSFGPNGKLAFTVRWNGGDNGYNASWYGVIDTGIWETVNTSYAAAWLWSDQTRLAISLAPAPEPSQAVLALTGLMGLLALGLARLRSTRQDHGLTQ